MTKRNTSDVTNASEKRANERSNQNVGNNTKSTKKLADNLDFLFIYSEAIDPVTRQKFTKDSYLEFIGISHSTLDNFRNETVSANRLRSMDKIVVGVNNWIKKDEQLKSWFPSGVGPKQLLEQVLEECVDKPRRDSEHNYYFYKLVGTYLCYYNSTEINDNKKKRQHFGVMQISEPNEKRECACSGVFAINDFAEAKRLHNEVANNHTKMEDATLARVFKGKAVLKNNLLWITLQTVDRDEFVSMSFDIAPKILKENPHKPFKGVRGLALSQSNGINPLSVVLPIVIKKTEIKPSRNELRRYLAFEHKPVDEETMAIRNLATNVIELISSFEKMSIDDELSRKLVAKILASGIEGILSTEIYNMFYYTPDQINAIYDDIISPEDDDVDDPEDDEDDE